MKNIGKLTAVILLIIISILLAACSGKNSAEPSGSGEKHKITVCLDWTPNTNHTGMYVALAKGYYDEAGLEVTIVQPPENGAVQACSAGQAQFAIDAQDTFAAALVSDTPMDCTAVAAIIQHNTSGIISLKGQGMEDPKGLEGKTYLTWDSPIELAMLENVVTKAGGDWSKVKLIPNTVTDEAQDVTANPDHAIWVFAGWSKINADVSGVETDLFYFKDINPVFDYYTPIIVANNKFLADSPDVAKAFLAATARGYQDAIDDPEGAAQMLIDGDTTGSLDGAEDLVYASQKWLADQYIADASKWGYIDPARWDPFYAWLYEEGLISRELPAGSGFSNDYLE